MSTSIEIALLNGRKYSQPTGLFINNTSMSGSDEPFAILNPTADEEIVTIARASGGDVDKAVAAARAAFEGPWPHMASADRGALLYKITELIDLDRKLTTSIDAFDNGKTYISAMEVDIDESYNVFQYYVGAADKICGSTIDMTPNKLAYVQQNYPFMMLAWKVAPALACGTTVVLEPAEQTPLSALYFGSLVIEAGLPAGLVNIIPGLSSITDKALAGHMGIDKIAVTGSTNTGRIIMKEVPNNLKNITSEYGGKIPSIGFGDADLE